MDFLYEDLQKSPQSHHSGNSNNSDRVCQLPHLSSSFLEIESRPNCSSIGASSSGKGIAFSDSYILITNLPLHCSDDEISMLVESFGNIDSFQRVCYSQCQKDEQQILVKYKNGPMALGALAELNRLTYSGKKLQ
jgi:hypothetical protein